MTILLMILIGNIIITTMMVAYSETTEYSLSNKQVISTLMIMLSLGSFMLVFKELSDLFSYLKSKIHNMKDFWKKYQNIILVILLFSCLAYRAFFMPPYRDHYNNFGELYFEGNTLIMCYDTSVVNEKIGTPCPDNNNKFHIIITENE
jgi:uncharacterized membrane protein